MSIKNINLLTKFWYCILFAYSASVVNTLPQFEAKGIYGRLFIYTINVVGVYVVWLLWPRLRKFLKNKYPHFVDGCVTFIVSFDLFGNIFDLYDSIWWWDDAVHLFLIIPFALTGAYFFRHLNSSHWVIMSLTFSYGLLGGVLWEIYEYFASTQSGRIEGVTGYPDTIGDLIMSVIGVSIAALIVGAWLRANSTVHS